MGSGMQLFNAWGRSARFGGIIQLLFLRIDFCQELPNVDQHFPFPRVPTYKNFVFGLHDSTETLFSPLRYTQPVRAHILTRRRDKWQPVREADPVGGDTAKPPARV
jgi:hypothetical protein